MGCNRLKVMNYRSCHTALSFGFKTFVHEKASKRLQVQQIETRNHNMYKTELMHCKDTCVASLNSRRRDDIGQLDSEKKLHMGRCLENLRARIKPEQRCNILQLSYSRLYHLV